MATTTKRFIILLLLGLLVVTGLGSALMAEAAHSAAPTSTGLVFSPSTLDVAPSSAGPLPGASVVGSQGAASATVLDWQLQDAWAKGDWNQCISVLTTILSFDVANSEARDRLYQARVNYGWFQLASQQFEEAYKQFNLALQVRPGGQEATEGLRLLQQLIVCPATPAPMPTPCAPVCIPAAEPTLPAPAGGRIYVVQRGDTLFRLALRFNTSVAVLMKANGLQTTTIKAGQKLVIP